MSKSTIQCPAVVRMSLLTLGLSVLGSQAVSTRAHAGTTISPFWRDLEAYTRQQRSQFQPPKSPQISPSQEVRSASDACIYVHACLPGTDLAHPYVQSEDSRYIYSGYTLPERISYTRFEEVYPENSYEDTYVPYGDESHEY